MNHFVLSSSPLGTRVYATSTKPPLQQGSAVATPATGAAYKHEGQPLVKSEAQVDKELSEGKFDYWGIRRKQLYKEDGTPWMWHSFTVSDANLASVDLPILSLLVQCLPGECLCFADRFSIEYALGTLIRMMFDGVARSGRSVCAGGLG